MKLKTKFSIGILSLLTVSIGMVSAIPVLTQQRVLKKEIRQHHFQLLEGLARVSEESLYESNLVFSNFVETLRKERGFREAFFVDRNDIIRFHSDEQRIDMPLKNHDPNNDFVAPILFTGKPVGFAHLVISQESINQFLKESLHENLKRVGLTTLVVLAFAWGAAIIFARRMVKPIEHIIRGMKRVSKGRLEPIHFPPRKDELGWMGREINLTIDKLKELDEMKQDFVAGVTHDLKSPLKGIQSLHAWLLKHQGEYSANELKDSLLMLQNNTNRLNNLINDLLTTAKIESGGETIEGRLFDLRKPLEEVAEIFKMVSKEKEVSLTIESSPKPIYVWADREKVVQITSNLVSNALKYTDEGSVTLKTGTHKDFVSIQVKDTGSGIPKEDRVKIFDKFYRSRSNAKLAKGTGLGLFISKGFVQAHHGTMMVIPNGKKGTVIEFTLPKSEDVFYSSASNR